MSTFFTAPRDHAGRLFVVLEDYPEDCDDMPFDPVWVGNDEPHDDDTMAELSAMEDPRLAEWFCLNDDRCTTTSLDVPQ